MESNTVLMWVIASLILLMIFGLLAWIIVVNNKVKKLKKSIKRSDPNFAKNNNYSSKSDYSKNSKNSKNYRNNYSQNTGYSQNPKEMNFRDDLNDESF